MDLEQVISNTTTTASTNENGKQHLEELELNGFKYVVGLTTQTRRPRLYIYYKEGDKDSCVCYYVHNDDTARCIGCLNYIKYDKVRKIFLTNPAECHGKVVTKEEKCYFGSNEIKDKQFQLVFLAKCEGEGVQNLEVFKANFKNSYETIFGKMTAKVRDSMRKRIERALAEKVANNSINEIDDVFRFPSLFPAPGEVVVNDEAVFNEIDNGGEVVVNGFKSCWAFTRCKK